MGGVKRKGHELVFGGNKEQNSNIGGIKKEDVRERYW